MLNRPSRPGTPAVITFARTTSPERSELKTKRGSECDTLSLDAKL